MQGYTDNFFCDRCQFFAVLSRVERGRWSLKQYPCTCFVNIARFDCSPDIFTFIALLLHHFFRTRAVAFISFLLVPMASYSFRHVENGSSFFFLRDLVVMQMFLDVMVKKFLRIITCTAGYLPPRQEWPGTDAIFNRRDSLISYIFLFDIKRETITQIRI